MTKKVFTAEILDNAYKKYFGYRPDGKADCKSRYSSWDLCYEHFKKFFNKKNIIDSDIREAALHLGFYLGSFGMLRNQDLLNSGIEKYDVLVGKLRNLYKENLEPNQQYAKQYAKIEESLADLDIGTKDKRTLITKIMLGVYANTPALDRFFKYTAKQYCEINFDSKIIRENISENIDKILQNPTIKTFIEDKIDDESGLTEYKILDAVFFQIGKDHYDEEKKNKN